jgi:hypothetical protein
MDESSRRTGKEKLLENTVQIYSRNILERKEMRYIFIFHLLAEFIL